MMNRCVAIGKPRPGVAEKQDTDPVNDNMDDLCERKIKAALVPVN